MLKDKIARMLVMKKVIAILVVVGVLGTISTGFEKCDGEIWIEMKVEHF